MQEKIQEIMGLVDAAVMGAEGHEATDMIRAGIESKLRELVREPLGTMQIIESIRATGYKAAIKNTHLDIFRAAERAHNITNTSGVE